MRYYRCECGEREAWSSMGVARCEFCPKCATTLDEAPNQHGPPEPHRFGLPEWDIDPASGERFRVRRCQRCPYEERTPVDTPTLNAVSP